MIPANLIINADDFGLDARVSRAIALCLDEGLINSFSVYPFADAFHADLLRDIVARHPGVRVGAHLSLLGPGMPERPGHFRDFLSRYLTGRFPAERVRGLWKAQVQALQARLGGTGPAHLDSHQHLHVLPGLWEAARSLQEEFRIPRLRVPYESLGRAVAYRFPFGLGLQALARMRAGGGKPGFLGFFTSTRFTVAGNRAGLARVAREPGLRFELMVHPALPGEPGSAGPAAAVGAGIAPLAPGQDREIEELRKLRAFFAPAGQR
jgi:predicted glycoside hydrolase/deacetylase ChbG (UPF0249 family)